MDRGCFSRRDVLRSAAGLTAALALGPIACSNGAAKPEVVLYTSVDQPIVKGVIDAFQAAHADIAVRLVTDTEASKSVGLATRLRAERANPICHVWWGNEVFHTIGLAAEGFFDDLGPLVADRVAPFKDAANRWAGNGLRARVMCAAEGIDGVTGKLDDLLDPRFKGRVAIARPLAGTTGGHVAALYALWGEERADAFFRRFNENGGLMLGGNVDVAEQVGRGTIAIGLTDNDDCAAVLANGGKLSLIPLEQHNGGIGTLAIPTTVARVARTDRPADVDALVSYLLSADVEQRLADAKFTAYSVRGGTPTSLKTMAVDYDAVAQRLQTAPKRAVEIIEGRA